MCRQLNIQKKKKKSNKLQNTKKNPVISTVETGIKINTHLHSQQKCDHQQYVTGTQFHELLSFIWWEKSTLLSTSCLNISPLRQTAGVSVSDAVCAERLLELKEWFDGHSQYRVPSSSAAGDCLIPID